MEWQDLRARPLFNSNRSEARFTGLVDKTVPSTPSLSTVAWGLASQECSNPTTQIWESAQCENVSENLGLLRHIFHYASGKWVQKPKVLVSFTSIPKKPTTIGWTGAIVFNHICVMTLRPPKSVTWVHFPQYVSSHICSLLTPFLSHLAGSCWQRLRLLPSCRVVASAGPDEFSAWPPLHPTAVLGDRSRVKWWWWWWPVSSFLSISCFWMGIS